MSILEAIRLAIIAEGIPCSGYFHRASKESEQIELCFEAEATKEQTARAYEIANAMLSEDGLLAWEKEQAAAEAEEMTIARHIREHAEATAKVDPKLIAVKDAIAKAKSVEEVRAAKESMTTKAEVIRG